MDNETRERIEKDAHNFSKKHKAMHEYDYAFAAYVRAAEAEHSRITELLKALESITLSMSAHPDCTEGSEFHDMVSIANKAIEKVKGKQQ